MVKRAEATGCVLRLRRSNGELSGRWLLRLLESARSDSHQQFGDRSEFRRRGLARQLLARVLHEAALLGAPTATLEVRRSNTAARELYEGAGFKLVGVRTSYYSNPIEDALILTRESA